mmetsp:Transcript_7890/g.22392  ORF Transcript_7890/g.22392 Transcript_7890/m.22392 type:complete len:268 (-) Transcript_7890:267-1070(-)
MVHGDSIGHVETASGDLARLLLLPQFTPVDVRELPQYAKKRCDGLEDLAPQRPRLRDGDSQPLGDVELTLAGALDDIVERAVRKDVVLDEALRLEHEGGDVRPAAVPARYFHAGGGIRAGVAIAPVGLQHQYALIRVVDHVQATRGVGIVQSVRFKVEALWDLHRESAHVEAVAFVNHRVEGPWVAVAERFLHAILQVSAAHQIYPAPNVHYILSAVRPDALLEQEVAVAVLERPHALVHSHVKHIRNQSDSSPQPRDREASHKQQR